MRGRAGSGLLGLALLLSSGCMVFHLEGDIPESLDIRHRVKTNLVLDHLEVVVRDDVELRVQMRNVNKKLALKIDWFAAFEGPVSEEEGLEGEGVIRVKTKRPQTGRQGVLNVFPGEKKLLEVRVPWTYSGRYQFGISSVETFEVAEEYLDPQAAREEGEDLARLE